MHYSNEKTPKVLSYLSSPISNIKEIDIESFSEILTPIELAINEENRRKAIKSENFLTTLKSEKNKTVTTQRSKIEQQKTFQTMSQIKPTITIHTEPGSNRIKFGRTEGKPLPNPDKMELQKEMLTQIISLRGVINPPSFQLQKKQEETPKFIMQNTLIDEANKENRYLSKIEVEYKQK